MLGARRATITSTRGRPVRARAERRLAAGGGTGGPRRARRSASCCAAPAGRSGCSRSPTRAEREFTPRDEAILAQLGQLASVAIAKSQAYTRERHIAQVLQRSLLPPSLPPSPGSAAAVRFIAAGEGIEVGGDFYDFFRARAGRASRR